MIKTILKYGLMAAGAYAIYRVATGRKIIPGLAGYEKRTLMIDRSHPRSQPCCGQEEVTYEVWNTNSQSQTRYDPYGIPTTTASPSFSASMRPI